jgi:hypothetical protein
MKITGVNFSPLFVLLMLIAVYGFLSLVGQVVLAK